MDRTDPTIVKHDTVAHLAGGGLGILVEDCPACLDTVVARCDCWPEAALRVAPHDAVHARNHAPRCPVSENPFTRG